MPDCISPPQARITVAPSGADVALTLTAPNPATCTLSPSQAKELARDLITHAGTSCDLVTMRGLTLHLWHDGLEAGRVTLSTGAALALLADLAKGIRGAA